MHRATADKLLEGVLKRAAEVNDEASPYAYGDHYHLGHRRGAIL